MLLLFFLSFFFVIRQCVFFFFFFSFSLFIFYYIKKTYYICIQRMRLIMDCFLSLLPIWKLKTVTLYFPALSRCLCLFIKLEYSHDRFLPSPIIDQLWPLFLLLEVWFDVCKKTVLYHTTHLSFFFSVYISNLNTQIREKLNKTFKSDLPNFLQQQPKN